MARVRPDITVSTVALQVKKLLRMLAEAGLKSRVRFQMRYRYIPSRFLSDAPNACLTFLKTKDYIVYVSLFKRMDTLIFCQSVAKNFG